MKRIIFTALLIGAAFCSYAQHTASDYLVTTAGDTLYGRITTVDVQQQILRLQQPDKPNVEYTASQVSSYGSSTGLIGLTLPVEPQGSPKLLSLLVSGPVSLYSAKDTGGDTRFYLQPHDSAYVVAVQPATARLQYLRVLKGCSQLDFTTSQIEKNYPYRENGLVRLVTTYNACRYPQQSSITNAHPNGVQTRFGIKGGTHTSSFRYFTGAFSEQQQRSFSYQGGAFIRVITRKQLALQIEANYLAMRGKFGPSNIYNGNAAYTTTQTLNIHYAQLQLPILVRYTLGHKQLQPYLTAGPCYGFNMQRKSTNVYQNSDGSPATVKPVTIPSTNSVGGVAGIGVELQPMHMPRLFLETRVDYLIDSAGIYDITPTHTTVRLDAGILF